MGPSYALLGLPGCLLGATCLLLGALLVQKRPCPRAPPKLSKPLWILQKPSQKCVSGVLVALLGSSCAFLKLLECLLGATCLLLGALLGLLVAKPTARKGPCLVAEALKVQMRRAACL